MLEGKGTSLCFLVIWTLREILVLNNSWQYWHEYLSEEVICLASMWYLTFVDFDWKPHCTHCHLPPPSAVIISFNPCNNRHLLGVSMFSAHVNIARVLSFKICPAYLTVISLACNMLGLNMIPHIGGLFCLVAALRTLPPPPAQGDHHGIKSFNE